MSSPPASKGSTSLSFLGFPFRLRPPMKPFEFFYPISRFLESLDSFTVCILTQT